MNTKIWLKGIGSQRIFANLQKNCCFIFAHLR
jgi:hypothetical protein